MYGIGPYIADYPEQCLLACVVSGWCPQCASSWCVPGCWQSPSCFSSCISPADDLDGGPDIHVHWSHKHTEDVQTGYEGDLKLMWDGYGIIGDVVVSA